MAAALRRRLVVPLQRALLRGLMALVVAVLERRLEAALRRRASRG